MTKKKSPSKRLTDEEKRRAINPEFQTFLRQLGFDPNLSEAAIRFGPNSKLAPEQQRKLAEVKGLQIGFQMAMEKLLPDVHTQEDLEEAVQAIRAGSGERAPTAFRETMDLIRQDLRRRGGRRPPKLTTEDSVRVCDQIARLMRYQKLTLKEALSKTSEMCPTLLKKKVSPRTLQKAWGKRDEFTGT